MITKAEKIRESLRATREKRANQRCMVFELKIKDKKLNKTRLNQLKMYFVQAKWLRNYLLSGEVDVFNFDTKTREIYSLDKDGNKVPRTLTLPSKIIQSVHGQVKQDILSLAAKKKKGKKVGGLKFKSVINSIDLCQYNNTHAIKDGRFRICGFKKLFHVFGLEQIPNDVEFANAKLIQKASGFYIKITCFKQLTHKYIAKPTNEVGLDYGIKTSLTTSDNEKFHVMIEEHDRLKGLQRKLARQVKGSNNYRKTKHKLEIEYEKLSNRKNDKANKLVNYLCTRYSTVYMQDEMIKSWHRRFGRQVQHSILGRLKSKLMQQPNVQVISKSLPTTKLCYNCGSIHKDISLADRQYVCPVCGFSEERDLKAAKTILFMGQCKNTYIPVERRSTAVERMSDFLSSYEDEKHSSLKQRSHEPKGSW